MSFPQLRSDRVSRVVVIGAVAALTLTGCGVFGGGHHSASPPPSTLSRTTPTPASTPTAPPVKMVKWHGPVMGIFFHPLVIKPKLAFTNSRIGKGFQDYFVSVYEFRRMLQGLWRHGWTLVDAHKAAHGNVEVPKGRKPLVLSEDDVNYYRYFHGHGLASRLILDSNGDVRAQLPNGKTSIDDVVPLVDQFVAKHPEFSADGAKGVLGETGYEGLFGYHHLKRPGERADVRALAAKLKSTGWLIASHTYGHIDLTTDSLSEIATDTRKWKALAQPLIGKTNLLIYPFGARPTAAGARYLRQQGYKIQFDIDVIARRYHLGGAIVMSRLHIDGFALEAPQRMKQFFSARRVRDPDRPPGVPGG